jgi:hypothetical protein
MKNFILISIIAILFFSNATGSFAQQFLNGDFEKTSAPAGVDQINLSNDSFNSMMANSFAFGTYGDMDIINSAVYSGAAQHGSWFVAFTGGGTDAISMELSSPLIAGKSYSISFWDKASSSFIPQEFQIGVSTEKSAFGTPVYTAEMPVTGIWTKRSFSFTAPLSGNYITVQLAGTNDISKWAQADNFSLSNSENQIITGTVNENTFCACSGINVPFTAKGIFSPGNIFTVQLSDENGNFSNPLDIGNLMSSANSGMISCNIPCKIAASTKYRVRVVSSLPEISGCDNGIDLNINNEIPFVAYISASTNNVIKQGTAVTFRPETSDKKIISKYQWMVNGTTVSGSETYTSSNFKDGDIVCLMVSIKNPCSNIQKIISNEIIMNVLVPAEPSVIIEALGSSTIQKGKSLTFVATYENAGTNPKFQWKINDENAGGNSDVFTSKNLKDGDEISVVMMTNLDGQGVVTLLSNTIMVNVSEPILAEKDKLVPEKKNNDKYRIGILKRKPFMWGKKGRKFYKPMSFRNRKNKSENNTCYRY